MSESHRPTILSDLLWALIGLLLTINATLLQAFIASPAWNWGQGLHILSLRVTYQVGAVLLVGCLGGKTAAALSQLAYIILGLTWQPIFAQGGGLGYVLKPSFGYLLGFIPGAWVSGYLAFKFSPRLESLALSCFSGLVSIHLTGIVYLLLTRLLGWVPKADLLRSLVDYSVTPLPGQFAVMCAVTVIAFALRRIMFY